MTLIAMIGEHLIWIGFKMAYRTYSDDTLRYFIQFTESARRDLNAS